MSVATRPAPPPPVRKGQVLAYEAVSSYTAKRDNELSFEEGDLLFILDQSDANWWLATLDSKKGYIPKTYLSSQDAKMPIVDAARRGNLAMVEECLSAGMSVNSLDKSGASALHAAAQGGHAECVVKLLRQPKLEINLQNKIGDTALHCAAYRGHTDVVQLLIKAGAHTEIVNREKASPRNLAKKSSVIALLDEVQSPRTGQRTSGFDMNEYGADASDDSDT